MMNPKKIISLIVVFVLCVSLGMAAYAQESSQVLLSQETIHNTDGTTIVISLFEETSFLRSNGNSNHEQEHWKCKVSQCFHLLQRQWSYILRHARTLFYVASQNMDCFI